MDLAHTILDFFNDAYRDGNVLRPFSFMHLVEKYPDIGPKVYRNIHYCKKLEQEGLLDHQGRSGDHPFYGHHYYTNKGFYDSDLSKYGSYELLVQGFLAVRERFRKIVLAISVTLANDDLSVGSGFVYSNECIITARHCIDGKFKKITIMAEDGTVVPVDNLYIPNNPYLDIAVLKTSSKLFETLPSYSLRVKEEYEGKTKMDELNYVDVSSIILLGPGKILDDVLTLGYPPIAGFEAILIADKSAINSTLLRSSTGQLLAGEKEYKNGIKYFLLNAKVKGGNSGGPVFDKLGRVVGMIVAMPPDIKNSDELDKLGYGMAIPSESIKSVLDDARGLNKTVREIDIIQMDGGSFTLKELNANSSSLY